MSKLSVVATPIGNMQDITLRALQTLSGSDFILCEDTRTTKRILTEYNITTKVISYHQHTSASRVEYILDLLDRGYHLSLVSEAGTPGISDPGGKLVREVVDRMGGKVQVESIPGPSAVTAALSISGIPADKFSFLGFPPHKKGRKKFIYSILEQEHTVVLYESKHRILKLMEELALAKNTWNKELEAETELEVVVCRELTKIHESVYRGEVEEVQEGLGKADANTLKGEFVIIINKIEK